MAPEPSAKADSTGDMTGWETITPPRTTATPLAFETRKSPRDSDHPAETRGSSGSASVVVCGTVVVVVAARVVVVVLVSVVEVEGTVVVDDAPIEHAPVTTMRATDLKRRDLTRGQYIERGTRAQVNRPVNTVPSAIVRE